MAHIMTDSKDRFYRDRLIADYDRLIAQYEEGIAKAGETFGNFNTPADGRLILAALRTARTAARADTEGQGRGPVIQGGDDV